MDTEFQNLKISLPPIIYGVLWGERTTTLKFWCSEAEIFWKPNLKLTSGILLSQPITLQKKKNIFNIIVCWNYPVYKKNHQHFRNFFSYFLHARSKILFFQDNFCITKRRAFTIWMFPWPCYVWVLSKGLQENEEEKNYDWHSWLWTMMNYFPTL